ncbi:MAG TPA: hypothetical protein VIP82_14835 [Microbacterium sp.]|uniref:hypothetical protein n=1 Tax=Microbacterium sp. TaxID=51671 RepID=UPI002F947973
MDPDVVVCPGASAARAVLDRVVKMGAERGTPVECGGRTTVITIHLSAVLRLRDSGERSEAIAGPAADLRLAAQVTRAGGIRVFPRVWGCDTPGVRAGFDGWAGRT